MQGAAAFEFNSQGLAWQCEATSAAAAAARACQATTKKAAHSDVSGVCGSSETQPFQGLLLLHFLFLIKEDLSHSYDYY